MRWLSAPAGVGILGGRGTTIRDFADTIRIVARCAIPKWTYSLQIAQTTIIAIMSPEPQVYEVVGQRVSPKLPANEARRSVYSARVRKHSLFYHFAMRHNDEQ